MEYNLITILGPTATGKTKLAAELAYYYNGEIISADSRQVYKGMDIGTGKDLSDYLFKEKRINYHLIDVAEPTEEFNLFRFMQMFSYRFNEITRRKNIPFLVGGSGLYLSSVIQNYNLKVAEPSDEILERLNSLSDDELIRIVKSVKSKLHNITDLTERRRMIEAIIISDSNKEFNSLNKIHSLNIGIIFPREVIKKRITERLKKRLSEGMIDEVKALIENGIGYDKLLFFGLEYKFIAMYLKGNLNYNDMFQKLNSAIHNFAKRQATWFKKMEKEGLKIFWIDGSEISKAKQIIDSNYFN